jgi:hypothetical protein
MTSHAGSTTSIQAAAGRVFIAIEVSKHDWLIAGHTPCDGRTSRHKCRGGDVQALLRVIAGCASGRRGPHAGRSG